MSLLIKNWQMADWKELLQWAKIGANNAMIRKCDPAREMGDEIDGRPSRED